MYQYLNDTQKKRIFNAVFIVFIFLAIFLLAETLNALKANGYIGRGTYATNIISVTGKGEVVAVPDTGEFYFSVVESGSTVPLAQDTAGKKVNAIIKAIKAQGVDEKDIKTSSYNSYPKYEYSAQSVCTNGYCPPGKQILTGYEVNETISVKVRKTADAGVVLTKVGDLGATNISGLNFVIDNIDSVQDEARNNAIKDAKAKAMTLSKSLGVKLVRIVNFDEGGSQPPVYYSMSNQSKGGVRDAMPTNVPELPTGQNKITSNVTITYEVE